MLQEEAEDDVELADGADGFTEAGAHAGRAADLAGEGVGLARGGLVESGSNRQICAEQNLKHSVNNLRRKRVDTG